MSTEYRKRLVEYNTLSNYLKTLEEVKKYFKNFKTVQSLYGTLDLWLNKQEIEEMYDRIRKPNFKTKKS